MSGRRNRRVNDHPVTASGRRRAVMARLATNMAQSSSPINTNAPAATSDMVTDPTHQGCIPPIHNTMDSDDEGITGDYGQVPHSVLLGLMSGTMETDPNVTRIPTRDNEGMHDKGKQIDEYREEECDNNGDDRDEENDHGSNGDDGYDNDGVEGDDSDSGGDGDVNDNAEDGSDDEITRDDGEDEDASDDNENEYSVDARESAPKSKRKIEDWVLKGPAPGGPMVPDLLTSYPAHVASALWAGEDRGVRRVHNRASSWDFKNLSSRAQALISTSRLQLLPQLMLEHVDHTLINAFVERWHPETNSFHMPFGEMTITLHDVFYILGLRPDGVAVRLSNDRKGYRSLLQDSRNSYQCDPKTVGFTEVENLAVGAKTRRVASLWLTYTLGSTLFTNKSGDRCHSSLYPLVQDPSRAHEYSWGSAALAWTYRQLGVASRAETKQISGCATLIQSWIYQYFPMLRPEYVTIGWTPNMPYAARWRPSVMLRKDSRRLADLRIRLDALSPSEINWMPYSGPLISPSLYHGTICYMDTTEPYMPDRVTRQFGFVQDIPIDPIKPCKECRSKNPRSYLVDYVFVEQFWAAPDSHRIAQARLGARIALGHETTPQYMSWYCARSHPRVVNPALHGHPSIPVEPVDNALALRRIVRALLPLLPSRRSDTLDYYQIVCQWDAIAYDHIEPLLSHLQIDDYDEEDQSMRQARPH